MDSNKKNSFSRMPYWYEKSSEQKIEYLQEELSRTQRHLIEITKIVGNLINHKHLHTGEIVIELHVRNCNEEYGMDMVYFREGRFEKEEIKR